MLALICLTPYVHFNINYSYCYVMLPISILLMITAYIALTVRIFINVTRFAKRVLDMHSFKTRFSSTFDNYTNGPTAHVFNTAES